MSAPEARDCAQAVIAGITSTLLATSSTRVLERSDNNCRQARDPAGAHQYGELRRSSYEHQRLSDMPMKQALFTYGMCVC